MQNRNQRQHCGLMPELHCKTQLCNKFASEKPTVQDGKDLFGKAENGVERVIESKNEEY